MAANILDFLWESDKNDIGYSTDRNKLNLDYTYSWLSNSYWANSIPRNIFDASVQNSICVGMYHGANQIGFARVITDGATFAWLADVFVDEKFQGQGISKNMMEFILSFPFASNLRRFMLATRDAHGLYRQYKFETPAAPDKLMEILKADIYQKLKTQ